MKTLNDLYRHMEWSDAAVWTAALASENGASDEKLRGYFHHLHLVQHLFLGGWRGEPFTSSFPSFDDANSLMLWGRSYYDEAFAYLETLSDEKLSAPFKVPWSAWAEERLGCAIEATTLRETALQVSLHSLYHRGQINARLREVGGEPPLVDYIAWIWLGRPAAAWPNA